MIHVSGNLLRVTFLIIAHAAVNVAMWQHLAPYNQKGRKHQLGLQNTQRNLSGTQSRSPSSHSKTEVVTKNSHLICCVLAISRAPKGLA